ncbi:MAG TPA: hypothetical protein H9694_01680 [Firmicutes bacterium]|nr:hypothetical protein [Bacillota bacterium]
MQDIPAMQEDRKIDEAPAAQPEAAQQQAAYLTPEAGTEGAIPSPETLPEGLPGEAVQELSGPVIRAKYNKKELAFTEQQAVPLVQKGLKFESFEPSYRKLKRLALAEGAEVPELLDRLLKQSDEAAYQRALRECGGNAQAARRLADFQRQEQERRAGGEPDTAQREFREVDTAFPGRFAGEEELPAPVAELAARRGISLLDALLRYDHEQARQAEAAQLQQEEAAKAAAGPMAGDPARADLDVEAFSAAFAAALH